MAKPQEVCTVVAGGAQYNIWESVEVSHSYDPTIDHAMMTVAEPSAGATTLSVLKLKPGDKAQVYLAGILVLDGTVYLRQAAYDANSHAVQIGISSLGQNINVATVKASPGQYTNQTLQQIASAAFGAVGVNFSIEGSPAGVEIPFPRVSEHIGETLFDFIWRLTCQRNIHMMDDGNGGIVGFRGPKGSGLVLKEGFNILRARLLLKNNDAVSEMKTLAQDHNQASGDANRSPSASATVPNATVNRSVTFAAEETHSAATVQYRVNHEVDFVNYQNTDGEVTVPGWLCPDNSLWMAHVRELVTLDSPMLIPPDSDNSFMIKGVTHRQSSAEGTTTTISLCDKDGLGLGSSSPLFTSGASQG
jgi:prophage tail gpP-like protein